MEKNYIFEVGDEVCWDHKGVRGIIAGRAVDYENYWIMEHIDANFGWSRDGSIPETYKAKYGDTYWFIKPQEMALISVTKRSSKKIKDRPAKPAKFALQFELDKNPTEYFATLPEVKSRIKELSSNSSLKRDKIFLHTLSKTQKVELGTSITIRKA